MPASPFRSNPDQKFPALARCKKIVICEKIRKTGNPEIKKVKNLIKAFRGNAQTSIYA
jgi:hypothetical protein